METVMILLFSPADTDLLTAQAAVVLRLLGGKPAFAQSFDWLKTRCQTDGIAFLPLPGDPQPDPELSAEGSLPLRVSSVVFDYLIRGGVPNFVNLACFLSDTCRGTHLNPAPPQDLPWEGVYHPAVPPGEDAEVWLATRHDPHAPTVGVLFYRAQ